MSRDQKEICLYCKWWVLEGFKNDSEELVKRQVGECHRYGPARRGGEHYHLMNDPEWVRTHGGDFCGEFKNRPDDHDSWQSIGDAATAVISGLNVENDDAA